MRISIVLKPQHAAELEQRAAGGYWHRGSFLTVPAFANRYGQSPAVVKSFLAYLRGHGLQATAYRNRLNIAVIGKTSQINAVFGVKLKDYRVAAARNSAGQTLRPAQVVHGTTQPATLPAPLAKATLGVLGLTSYHGALSNHAQRARVRTVHATAKADNGPLPGQLTPADFLRLYHGKTLQQVSKGGAGQTIGIVTLATAPLSDIYSFWRQLGIKVSPNKVTLRNIDGGSGAPSVDAGSDETALDVEQSGGIAPAAKVIVYQAPNTEAGFSDAFFKAATDNKAGSVSTSWGASETYYQALIATGGQPTTYARIVDVPLLEAAAQGQATFQSSGDSGAYDASADVGSTNLSVDVSAESRYILAAGGTTLSASQYGPLQFGGLPGDKVLTIKLPRERAWGWDYFNAVRKEFNLIDGTHVSAQDWAVSNVAGSGGGQSELSPMPSYQRQFPGISLYSAVENLTPSEPTNTFDGMPKLPFTLPSNWVAHTTPALVNGQVTGNHRLVPDLSTNGDPETGYGVYSKLLGPVYGGNWQQYGGTSFVSPQLNGVSALIQAQAGGRVGLWNPSIYRFARWSNSPFRSLNAQGTSAQATVKQTADGPVYTVPGNNNMYYSGRPGTKYNMGVGLGIPNLTQLGNDFSR